MTLELGTVKALTSEVNMDAEKAFTAIAINSVTGNKELMKRYGAKSQEMPVSELETFISDDHKRGLFDSGLVFSVSMVAAYGLSFVSWPDVARLFYPSCRVCLVILPHSLLPVDYCDSCLNPLCSDPIGEGCTELAVGGLWSEPVCQHCFDHMHDCKGCKEAIPDQDEHGTLDYCAECAKELGVDQ